MRDAMFIDSRMGRTAFSRVVRWSRIISFVVPSFGPPREGFTWRGVRCSIVPWDRRDVKLGRSNGLEGCELHIVVVACSGGDGGTLIHDWFDVGRRAVLGVGMGRRGTSSTTGRVGDWGTGCGWRVRSHSTWTEFSLVLTWGDVTLSMRSFVHAGISVLMRGCIHWRTGFISV